MDAKRSIVMVSLAGTVMILGTKIPLPGMDGAAIAAQMSGSPDALSRLSIFALGLMPLYNALAVVEFGRLFLAQRGGRQHAPGRVEMAIVAVMALAVTALQGYGIVQALDATGLLDGTSPMIGMATFMGATALLVFLCWRVQLPGFRHGFWALWSVPVLVGLPRPIAQAVELTRTGAMSGTVWPIFAVYLGLSVAAIVFMATVWKTARRDGNDASGDAMVSDSDILIWPPVLASLISSYLLTLVAVTAPGIFDMVGIAVLQAILLVITCLLIPVLVYAYARRSGLLLRDVLPALAMTVIVPVQIGLVVSGGVLNLWGGLPVALGFVSLLAVTLTVLELFARAVAPNSRPASQTPTTSTPNS